MGFLLEGKRKALRFPKVLFAFCSLFLSLVLQSKGVKFNCANFLRKKMKLFFEGIKKPPISQGFNQKLNYENNAKTWLTLQRYDFIFLRQQLFAKPW